MKGQDYSDDLYVESIFHLHRATELAAALTRIGRLETAILNLTYELPDFVLEEIREVLGNTQTNCIQRRRDEARAELRETQ